MSPVGSNSPKSRHPSPVAAVSRARRGNILIFTLAALTLLALIGIGLLGGIRADQTRVRAQLAAAPLPSLLDEVAGLAQQRLRADLWQPAIGGPLYLTASSNNPPADGVERNEPFDAPGPFDRWLGSTLPYRVDPNGMPFDLDDFLVWPRVSYMGGDVFARDPAIPGQALYASPQAPNGYSNDALFSNVAALTPGPLGPAAIGLPIGTTIAEGRRVWFNPAAFAASPDPATQALAGALLAWQALPQNAGKQFPYWDANLDGIPDLYDADGDGVPDSPISFKLPYTRRRGDDPQDVYAAVRIIDNASMINVNTAWALDTNGDGVLDTQDLFGQDASIPDQQLRGRRVCEVSMDAPLVQAMGLLKYSCIDDGDRALLPGVLTFRRNGQAYLRPAFNGTGFYDDVVRRVLVGGLPPVVPGPYPVFDATDELALRTRFSLSEYLGPSSFTANRFAVIERGLPNSLGAAGWRWQRFTPGDAAGSAGYVAQLDADLIGVLPSAPTAALSRRLLFTTRSLDSTRTPHQQLGGPSLPGLGAFALDDGAVLVPLPTLPLFALREKPDLNPVWFNAGGNPVNPTSAELAEYAIRLAEAIHAAAINWNLTLDAASGLPAAERPAPDEIAWQLAANIIDYVDADDVPTVIVDPGKPTPETKVKYVGLEAQPFISKFGARFSDDGAGTVTDNFAIELINPYPRLIPANTFSIRVYRNAAFTDFPLPAFNPGSGNNPTRVVLLQENDATVTLPGGASPSAQAGFDFQAGDHLVLVRRLATANGVVEWPLDEAEVGQLETPPAGETRNTLFGRDERDWRFAVARDERVISTDLNLDLTRVFDLSSLVAPSHWLNRSLGFGVRGFESPAELSRLIAVGTVSPRPGGLPPGNAFNFRTSPRYLALAQFGPNGNIAAGRIDCAAANSGAGALFSALTCSSNSGDGIDNDGDGLVDNAFEAARVAYRDAGRINVNTAPSIVLRTVPFMHSMVVGNDWDCAAGIVAWREGRAVPGLFPGAGRPGPNPPPNRGLQHFRTLADLILVTGDGQPRCAPRQFVADGVDLPSNNGQSWSPDFDAEAARDDAITVRDDIRERDALLARWSNILSARSDVFTVYVVLFDENGNYLRRTQFTIDRSACTAEDAAPRRPVLPEISARHDTDYFDDTR